ncbi:MAG: hypothetical protein AAFN92_15025 [Bacteroidota bacterium]
MKDLNNRTLPATDPAAMLAYHRELTELSKTANAARGTFNELSERVKYYRSATRLLEDEDLEQRVAALEDQVDALRITMYGDPLKRKLEIDQAPSLSRRINTAIYTGMSSLSDPTETSKMVKKIAEEQLSPVLATLQKLREESLPAIDAELDRLGAPWTPGRVLRPRN